MKDLFKLATWTALSTAVMIYGISAITPLFNLNPFDFQTSTIERAVLSLEKNSKNRMFDMRNNVILGRCYSNRMGTFKEKNRAFGGVKSSEIPYIIDKYCSPNENLYWIVTAQDCGSVNGKVRPIFKSDILKNFILTTSFIRDKVQPKYNTISENLKRKNVDNRFNQLKQYIPNITFLVNSDIHKNKRANPRDISFFRKLSDKYSNLTYILLPTLKVNKDEFGVDYDGDLFRASEFYNNYVKEMRSSGLPLIDLTNPSLFPNQLTGEHFQDFVHLTEEAYEIERKNLTDYLYGKTKNE